LLTHPTLELLADLGLHGMAKGFRDLSDNPEAAALGHAEWLGILLERESTLRQQKRFEGRAKAAKLRHLAAVEDVDYRTPRGLDRAMFLKLAGCDWIRERRHCLLTGPAGVGKSWLACALGYKACRENLSVFYQRVPRLFAALALARSDGRYARLLKQLARVDLLILDDWGPEPLLAEQQRDLLEIVEDRYSAGSLIITSQVPIDRWYEIVGNPALADAILDRIIHNAPHRTQGREPAQTARRRLIPTTICYVTENRAMPRGRKPAGEQALSNAERQARYRARRMTEPVTVVTRTRRPADAAAGRSVGATRSTNCWRFRPGTPSGSRRSRRAWATVGQPRHSRRSSIWISPTLPRASHPEATGATDPRMLQRQLDYLTPTSPA
jgi:DNA replication protein DnaC